ncbi:sensor domain-containing diguanylate cyclase [Massilia sp. YIM B02763]|uniref:sensor domain-containing diguanylate cyclase n=1 Tax=Massilia sp. YIM B02763 TaxID=3050130 RepID=UPI0025B71D49|nr:sensor domain-containing diguanylate cyclase [Massilia sp. YIM B02763]MDN4056293.1 sensor domain-containing diguanylate cyclase [Massilia sp. YIM B02763]
MIPHGATAVVRDENDAGQHTDTVATLRRRRRPIIPITIAFIVLANIALAAMLVWSSLNARSLQLENATISTANTAQALADQAHSAVKMADTILVGMIDRIENEGLSTPQALRLRRVMTEHLADGPGLQGLFIYDAAGNWVVNSVNPAFEGRNNADRAYFRYHRDHPDRGPLVGAPILGRASNAWVIPISRRLEHRDGSFAGVVLATIKIDFFRRVYRRLDVGTDGDIALALADGTLIVGTPFLESGIGRNIAATPAFRAIPAGEPKGTFEATQDGNPRLYSFARASGYPLVLLVSRSKDALMTGWRNTTAAVSVALLLLIGGLAALGWRLVHQIGLRDRLEHELLDTKAALETTNATLASLAYVDGLTGLFNRRYYEQALDRELQRARRLGAPLALLMLDVDHFKKYNDHYGHPAGDTCLAQVGEAIQRGLRRPGDVAARYGGEEFVVLLPSTDMAGATAVAEAIRAGVEEQALAHAQAPGGIVTISVGVCVLVPSDADDAAELVNRADAALYRAKQAGRNRVAFG